MKITIDEVKLSKTGKSYSARSGRDYYMADLKSGIEQVRPGTLIDCEIETISFAGGQTGKKITTFTAVQQALQGVKGITSEPLAKSYVDRWWMQFVSNQCAHAIMSGLVKEPADLSIWAKAAYNVVNALEVLQEVPADPQDPPF